jgi:serine/threonine protein kinase
MDQKNIENVEGFNLFFQLAQTKFSRVFLGNSDTNPFEFYAIKKIMIKIASDELIENLKSESKLLFSLNHSNIVTILKEMEVNDHFYFVLEYCEIGDGFDFLKRYSNFFKRSPTQKIIQKIILSLTKGVIYLHKKNILHRDLKLKNVLLKYKDFSKLIGENYKNLKFPDKSSQNYEYEIKKTFRNIKDFGKDFLFNFKNNISVEEFDDFFIENIDIKLIDLGVSKILKDDEITKSIIINNYSAPEMRNKLGYTFPSDFWNIGAIAYCLMTGKVPSILNTDNAEELTIDEKFWSSIEIIDFINCLLQKDPKKRLTEKNILQHPFLSKNPSCFKVQKCNFKLNFNKKENLCGLWEDVEFNDDKETNLETVLIENFDLFTKMPIKENYFDYLYRSFKK